MKKTVLMIVLTAAMLLNACTKPPAEFVANSVRSADATQPAARKSDVALDDVRSLIDIVRDMPTVQYFTNETVSQTDIEHIVQSGVNAQSAMNKQPWHFSVVTDALVLQRIADDLRSGMPGMQSAPQKLAKAQIADAPLVIIISADKGSEFDAGLACQIMCVAAVARGYGTKIISSPTIVLNGERQNEYKTLLGIPSEKSVVAALLIGKEDASIDKHADGYTGATPRNPSSETVSYIK
ncbi:MAG: nitroreductase family protein [Treponema sp.]|nr:nitroreductase family protein [Treponema sp.]